MPSTGPENAVLARVLEIAARQPGAVAMASRLLDDVVAVGTADLGAFVSRDPASRQDWHYVLNSYGGYDAVLSHRLAHALWSGASELPPPGSLTAEQVVARQISEAAKARTGVEIHPGAEIAPGLVIDHGYGTVIGETAEVGHDCYLLQGVVLGATGIADNGPGKRHPTLCDRVEVGAFARVLGPVTVGDDAFIGGLALVLDDVPAGAHVDSSGPRSRTAPGGAAAEAAS